MTKQHQVISFKTTLRNQREIHINIGQSWKDLQCPFPGLPNRLIFSLNVLHKSLHTSSTILTISLWWIAKCILFPNDDFLGNSTTILSNNSTVNLSEFSLTFYYAKNPLLVPYQQSLLTGETKPKIEYLSWFNPSRQSISSNILTFSLINKSTILFPFLFSKNLCLLHLLKLEVRCWIQLLKNSSLSGGS